MGVDHMKIVSTSTGGKTHRSSSISKIRGLSINPASGQHLLLAA
jgi:hypothetical protein